MTAIVQGSLASDSPGGATSTRGLARILWSGLLRRPVALASLVYLGLVAAASAAAPLLAPYDPAATDLVNVLTGPTADHLLGTDDLGRDVLTRLMYGGRISLIGVAEAVATLLILGVCVGVVAGYVGGWVDRLSSWAIDIMLALPGFVILLVVLAVFGTSDTIAMVALGVLGAPQVARVVRAATLSVRAELYVTAARVAGLPTWRIIHGQVLPRLTGPILVQAAIHAGGALLAQAGLSYLGLIAQPPTPTWGGMVAEGSAVIDRQPWLLVPPGVVIGLAILAFGLLGDAIRDITAERIARSPAAVRSAKGPAVGQETVDDHSEPEPGSILSLRDLTFAITSNAGPATVIESATLHVNKGETVGLVGESGCGKSLTGRAVLGLLPPGGRIVSGHIHFDGKELTTLTRAAWRKNRGTGIALISQEPLSSLDPTFTVGQQVAELVRRHNGGSRRAVRERTLDLLRQVRLSDPEAVARRYPHQLSGGMAQRVAIAIALAGNPKLLIADEPTTALDVTVQSEILDLIRALQRENDMAVLLISHDWGVIRGICTRAYVMYAGHIVESAPVADLVDQPRHPYTAALLACSPGRAQPRTPLATISGAVPAPGAWPTGCHFHPRCPLAGPECTHSPIPLIDATSTHDTRCVHHTQVTKEGAHGRAAAPQRP
ncbi:dipeptide/oligopeptide/nickel ABC transporter permease/ATP-binding protein [Phytohabitans kaempferiae]|uniref:Dipeptide/oligopeptide/nickel ABC transporter permease/ATP-binding protein n=1 Tax=Phytohabitans kaempferiae TaxID=1620943 RepID=A0ABV6MHL2_9ACTN